MASSHYEQGKDYYEKGAYSKAVMHFSLSATEDGQKPALHAMMAYCHYELGHFAQALDCCKKAEERGEQLKHYGIAKLKTKISTGKKEAWRRWRSLFDDTQKNLLANTKPSKMSAADAALKAICGDSFAIQSVIARIKQIADCSATVLIRGETGTGKELVAKAIHAYSQSSGKPFVSVNCGAFVETLLESELFGHKKGAFTGAIRDKVGKMVDVGRGSFFLDEVGDMSMQMQVKLLRALQDRRVVRVGGTKEEYVHARFIAATNRNLEAMVESGEFREDLYYRLNVIPILIPPLRERKEDIPLLVGRLVALYAKKFKKQIPLTIEGDALEVLVNHTWPGNVRELENVVCRIIALIPKIKTSLNVEDVNDALLHHEDSWATFLENHKALLLDVLNHTGWNLYETARFLEVDLPTVQRALRVLQVDK